MPGQYTDNSQWNDPVFQDKMQAMYRERDEPTRQKMIREMTGDILDKAPYIWLPVADTYAAWCPGSRTTTAKSMAAGSGGNRSKRVLRNPVLEFRLTVRGS